MVSTTVLALSIFFVQDPGAAGAATQPEPTLETVAEWGPVHSSTYTIVARFEDAREAMESGPAVAKAKHAILKLRELLPPKGTAVGEVWNIDAAPVLPMLAQFHAGVTSRLRHANPPQSAIDKLGEEVARKRYMTPAVEGGRATLLSLDDDQFEVLLRVHVEFELIPKKMWLLPAQHEGVMIWDRKSNKPISLHLRLPPRDTNFDINHHKGGADIGYLPLMQVATAGAKPAGPKADAARQLLRESFYPASKIQWRTLADAFARAKDNGRMLHVMQLFGTLDDESC